MTQVQPHEDGVPGLIEQVDPKPIHLNLILDVSPSMRSRWDQTLSGVNEYLDSLRKDQADNNQPYKVTMTTFSAEINKLYDDVELDTLPKFNEKNLSPHGWGTALYDAIGPTVQAIDTTEPVLVVIITDGEENSSHSWDSERLAKLMDDRQKLGNYTYAYLGVAKEAWGNAAKLGAAVTRSVSNITQDAYGIGTYSGGPRSLSTMTASYSAAMRSNSVKGASMNVANFFAPADLPDADADPVVSVTSATPVPGK